MKPIIFNTRFAHLKYSELVLPELFCVRCSWAVGNSEHGTIQNCQSQLVLRHYTSSMPCFEYPGRPSGPFFYYFYCS